MKPRFTITDQALFAHRLSLFTKAGVPILESLQVISSQTNSRGTRKVLEEITRNVAGGQFIWRSMSQFESVFGTFAVQMIRIGENTGTLSESLEHLSRELKKRRELGNKIWGALLYPFVLLVGSIGIMALLLFYLFPKLMPIFQSLSGELPLSTRMFIAATGFFIQYWMWIGVGVLCAGAILWIASRTPNTRSFLDRAILRLPFIGPLIREYLFANVFRTLGVLMTGGRFGTGEATSLAAETVSNGAYRSALKELSDAVMRGEPMSKSLAKNTRLFPALAVQMITVAERTGQLSDTCLYLGTYYESEVDEHTKRLSTVLEPALMIAMGIGVGFLAVSIITPIYAVTQHLKP